MEAKLPLPLLRVTKCRLPCTREEYPLSLLFDTVEPCPLASCQGLVKIYVGSMSSSTEHLGRGNKLKEA